MKNIKPAIILLCIIYTVGIVGILIPATRDITLSLTPVNLVVSLLFLLTFHQKYSLDGIFALLFVGICGYFLEVAGVATQSIFGKYQYGSTLGPKHWAVPFTMALNWIIPIYCTRIIAQKATKNTLLVALISASLMTGLDFILEPVAVFMDMWTWSGTQIPWNNYLVWFIASFAIQWAYTLMEKKISNGIAIPLFIIQLVFFGVIHLYTLFI